MGLVFLKRWKWAAGFGLRSRGGHDGLDLVADQPRNLVIDLAGGGENRVAEAEGAGIAVALDNIALQAEQTGAVEALGVQPRRQRVDDGGGKKPRNAAEHP